MAAFLTAVVVFTPLILLACVGFGLLFCWLEPDRPRPVTEGKR